MSQYRIDAEPNVDADIEAAFEWYFGEEPDLGFNFLSPRSGRQHKAQGKSAQPWV